MELYEITVTGYRKFRDTSRLKTNGKLVAILGANEAGKSSLLNAIARLNDKDAFEPEELSHDLTGDEIAVKARFLLDDADRLAAEMPEAIWFTVEKRADGGRTWGILPRPVGRDVSHREKLLNKVKVLSQKSKFIERVDETDPELISDLQDAFTSIQNEGEDLESTKIEELTALSERLVRISQLGIPVYARGLAPLLSTAIAVESAENARTSAGEELWKRRPRFLLFGTDDRNLKSSYTVSGLREEEPKALLNLMLVADCDLGELLDAYEASEDARVDTIIDRANEHLEEKFRSVWKQSAISVVLSIRDQTLYIQVRNPDRRRTSFSERSDGLRQFVALQSFTTASGETNPVLLIDEAEQHLHYDAQADLIQMLASQTVAPKVIYTTHSAGCLPEDLGNGVRLVTELGENREWSRVKNKFWDSKQSTLSPLLIGMGASTLAFFPMRIAVVVEGEADMLLYPTMIRQSLGRSVSGMQFVPGLSRIDKQQLPMLNTVGKGVCFLLDNDSGGRELERTLIRAGIEQQSIFKLSRPGQGDVELEDFLDADMLACAVNELSRIHFQKADLVSPAKMPKYGKWDFIARCCAEASIPTFLKVDVAYAVLDQIAENPGRALLDNRLSTHLARTASVVRLRLGLEAQ